MDDNSTNGQGIYTLLEHKMPTRNHVKHFSPLDKQKRDGKHPSDSPQRTGSRPPRILVEGTSDEVNIRD